MSTVARGALLGYWLCLWAVGGWAQSAGTNYRGYRLRVMNIEVDKRNDGLVKLTCDLINTGKFPLNGAQRGTRDYLIVTFDESLGANELSAYRAEIRAELLRNKLLLSPGRLERGRQYKVRLPASDPLDPPRLAISRVSGDSYVAGEEKTADADDRKERPKWARPRAPAPEPPLPEGVGFQTKTGESEVSARELQRQKKTCFDLVLRDVRVIRQGKKEVEVRYTIVNEGTGVAELTGPSASSYEDNLAVKVYISGVPKLSRGAMLLGGLWLDGEMEAVRGKLKPGQSLTGELTMDIRKKTRYLNHLILGLDAPLLIDECDRTNNTASLLLD